jgi:dTDP-4-dehydrorhamnose reductase
MKILLFGANGQVGWELQRALAPLGELVALARHEADLAQPVQPLIERHAADVIVNAAAYTAVDRAESEPELAYRINAAAVGEMAQAAARSGAWLVHYSTDYVFDGRKDGPYVETDAAAPLSTYGRSKLAGEEAIRAVPQCAHLILRTSWVYALRGQNFAHAILKRAFSLDRLQVVADTYGAPTCAELIADVTALALHTLFREAARAGARRPDRSQSGTYHLTPSGTTTWHGYASFLIEQARAAGLPLRVAARDIDPVPASAFPAPARRPLNSRLDHSRLATRFGLAMPDWRQPIPRLVDALAREHRAAAARP